MIGKRPWARHGQGDGGHGENREHISSPHTWVRPTLGPLPVKLGGGAQNKEVGGPSPDGTTGVVKDVSGRLTPCRRDAATGSSRSYAEITFCPRELGGGNHRRPKERAMIFICGGGL